MTEVRTPRHLTRQRPSARETVEVVYGSRVWIYDGATLQAEQPLLFWFASALDLGEKRRVRTLSGRQLVLARLA